MSHGLIFFWEEISAQQMSKYEFAVPESVRALEEVEVCVWWGGVVVVCKYSRVSSSVLNRVAGKGLADVVAFEEVLEGGEARARTTDNRGRTSAQGTAATKALGQDALLYALLF